MNYSNLVECYHSEATDKGTWHSYIEGFYAYRFTEFKDKPVKLLEIGVDKGSSIKLWKRWFTHPDATIIGLDINAAGIEVVNQIPGAFGYCLDAFTTKALDMFPNNFFDFIIEDGPHTLETQIFAVNNWTKKLKVGGKLVIEDVQNPDHDESEIWQAFKDRDLYEIKSHDWRRQKNRYDDYIIEITRK